MTALTPDVRDLLRECRSRPEDDTLRLVLADALDEAGDVQVKCPNGCVHHKIAKIFVKYIQPGGHMLKSKTWFRCEHCDGTGFVTDTSNHDRAELLRVQVELARRMPPVEVRETPTQTLLTYDHGDDWNELRARQSALLAAHPDWVPSCPVCKGTGETGIYVCNACPRMLGNRSRKGTGRIGAYHRGLLTLTVPTLDVLFERARDRCKVCHGFCPANQEPYERDGRWVWECFGCNGIGIVEIGWQIAPYARTLRSECPFTVAVGVTDRVPEAHARKMTAALTHRWYLRTDRTPSTVIPEFIYDLLTDWCDVGDGWKAFPTPEAANTALASAVARAIYDTEGVHL